MCLTFSNSDEWQRRRTNSLQIWREHRHLKYETRVLSLIFKKAQLEWIILSIDKTGCTVSINKSPDLKWSENWRYTAEVKRLHLRFQKIVWKIVHEQCVFILIFFSTCICIVTHIYAPSSYRLTSIHVQDTWVFVVSLYHCISAC